MRQGQILKITNSDPIGHNMNLTPWKGKSFNPLLPRATVASKATFDVPSLLAQPRPFPVKCNIHSWESAYVSVFDHPYFAVTDENGSFEIRHVPAGEVKLVFWQEKLGFIAGRNGREVEVKSDCVSALGDIETTLPN